MKIHTLVLGDLQTNCYIWADEGTGNAIVIDVPDSADKIIDFADKNGLKITDIILTHGHFDHMLGLAELKEKTGAELSVFEKTVDFINEKNLNLGFHMGVECPIAEADRILKDGDEITIGDISFNLLIISLLNNFANFASHYCLQSSLL